MDAPTNFVRDQNVQLGGSQIAIYARQLRWPANKIYNFFPCYVWFYYAYLAWKFE